MEIICIGDTHAQHEKLDIPLAETIVHTGDVTNLGTERETLSFLNWFSLLPHKNKIFIAGNHDFYLQSLNSKDLKEIIPSNVNYLFNSGVVINNIHFWGSPITPTNGNWAFHKERGKEIEKIWNLIPDKVDILVTHTPAYGILDKAGFKTSIGCERLLQKIETVKPQFHLFGHVHENYGTVQIGETTFINSTSFSQNLPYANSPIKVKTSAFS